MIRVFRTAAIVTAARRGPAGVAAGEAGATAFGAAAETACEAEEEGEDDGGADDDADDDGPSEDERGGEMSDEGYVFLGGGVGGGGWIDGDWTYLQYALAMQPSQLERVVLMSVNWFCLAHSVIGATIVIAVVRFFLFSAGRIGLFDLGGES